VLERPNNETAGPATVAPGAHTIGDYSVVWWDPRALGLGVKPVFGVRRDDLIVKDVPSTVVADGRSRYDRWCLARADARAIGAAPSLVVKTVREWTAEEPEARSPKPDVTLINLASAADRDWTGGAAFGSLVHALLAQAPFDATADQVAAIAAIEARVLGLTDDERDAAVQTARRVLRHSIGQRARAAESRGRCRRETPVTCTMPDGTFVEGIVDLAFEEDGAWVVVDYKTDRELAAEGEERYRRQVSLYAGAVERATGARASAVLIRI
jgi:ATP-dependent exoDNAse (exonuclease V) beta subunit